MLDSRYLTYLRRCILALGIVILLLMSVPVPGADNGTITLRLEDPTSQPTQSSPSTEPNPNQADAPTVAPPPQSPSVRQPDVKAASVVVMDLATGQVIYEKNPHMRRPNASTTKIMTAILLIEHCKMTDMIKASKKASETPFTSLNLRPGEKISVKDLLMGMLIRSANDAAVAAAEHIAGSVPKFAEMMNEKAAEIGCKDTHFVTPNGLHDDKHYSSAYDLCLMARYALKYPIFNEAINTKKHILDSRTINKKDLAVFARTKFMKDYPGADGVKSGYIKQAGYCYVGSATRNGWRLVSAVLKSDNAGRDTATVMDFGFNNFEPLTVIQAGQTCTQAEIKGGAAKTVEAAVEDDLKVVVPKTGAQVTTKYNLKLVEAPIARGAKLGTVTASVNGVDVTSVNLYATQDIGVSFARRAWWWIKTCSIVAICLMIGNKYGTAFTKNTRRRRRRVTASLRDFNRFR